jgi:hypothetical protein
VKKLICDKCSNDTFRLVRRLSITDSYGKPISWAYVCRNCGAKYFKDFRGEPTDSGVVLFECGEVMSEAIFGVPEPCDTCAYRDERADPTYCTKGLTQWWGNIHCPEYMDWELRGFEDFDM